MSPTKPKTKAAGTSKKSGKKVKFLQKPTCTTCRKARSFMEKRGFQLYFRDLGKEQVELRGAREIDRSARPQ